MPTRYSRPTNARAGLLSSISKGSSSNGSNPAHGLRWRWGCAGIGALLWGTAIGLGPAIALPTTAEFAQHHHSSQPKHGHGGSDHGGHEHGSGHGTHEHGRFDIPAGQPVPQVAIVARPDPMKGWNVQLRVQNFQFAPEQIDRPGAWNMGHAHLYINGRKLTRLYSSWYYLDGLPRGTHQVTVTLNTNSHQDLYTNGRRIEASTTITVP